MLSPQLFTNTYVWVFLLKNLNNLWVLIFLLRSRLYILICKCPKSLDCCSSLWIRIMVWNLPSLLLGYLEDLCFQNKFCVFCHYLCFLVLFFIHWSVWYTYHILPHSQLSGIENLLLKSTVPDVRVPMLDWYLKYYHNVNNTACKWMASSET